MPGPVPSLRHSSIPAATSWAVKNSVPFTSVMAVGARSATTTVPAAVPSLRQSFVPVPSSAEKKSLSPETVSLLGAELANPGLMSLIRVVPAGVPSLRHSSVPAAVS